MGKGKIIDKDLGWKEIMAAAQQLAAGASVRVGILGDTERGGLHKTDPETGRAERLTIAEIALVNEYGTVDGHIPARPAHRMAYDANAAKLQALSFRIVEKIVLDRTMTVERGLGLLGLTHATNIKRTITEGAGVPPPNAPSTVLAKVPASSKGKKRQRAIDGNRTLVDTGATINSISWVVEMGSEKSPPAFLPGGKGPA